MTADTKHTTVVCCLSKGFGGMEKDAIKTASLLAKNHKIYLVVKQGSYLEKHAKESDGAQFEVCAIKFSSKSFSPSLILGLNSLLEKKGEVKNFIFFGASELKSIYWSLRKKDIKLIVRHGTTKSTRKDSWYHRLIYSRVNHHVVISKHLLNNVKEIIPIGKDSTIEVIYPSFPVQNPEKKALSPSRTIKILHVGRIVEGKGQLEVLRACKVLIDEKEDVQVTIAGGVEDRDYYNEILDFIKTNRLEDFVKLTGDVKNISDYYRASDIFLFPSHGEGFGNAFCEALSYGLVCICYKNTALQEFTELGFYYHLVDNLNQRKLYEELKYCIKNYSEEASRSESNKDLSLKIFSDKKEMQNWDLILKK